MLSSLCTIKARGVYILVALFFLFHISISLGAEKDTTKIEKFSGVSFENNLLKVSVKKQSFKEVMDDVAKKSGIKICINCPEEEELTVSFGYLPLEKGIRLLLKDRNYAFKYRPGEVDDIKNSSSLINVFVFPKSEESHIDELQAMNTNETQNKIMERFNEALATQGIPKSGILQENQIEEVLMKIKEMGNFGKLNNVENENPQIPLTVKKDIVDRINKTLKGLSIEQKGANL